MLDCPDLAVPREVMQHVVHVESSRNPFAIGVVGGYLARQPKSLDEALAAVRQLKEEGYNFSVGISQVNRYNLAKYGLTTYAQAFEVCPNLQAGSRILRECYDRAQDWGKAFSCYYSGNFSTGFEHGYVQKVFASIQKSQSGAVVEPIRVIPYSNAKRKLAKDDGLALGGAMAGSSVVETAESRPAIPVAGPGALKPADPPAPSQRLSGLGHIPTQVIGVNGDPYQTRLLPPANPEKAGQSSPPVPAVSTPFPVVSRAGLGNASSGGPSSARKGGQLLHSTSSRGPSEVLEAGRNAEADQGKKTSASDSSFVF